MQKPQNRLQHPSDSDLGNQTYPSKSRPQHYTPPNLQEPTVGTLTTPQRVLPIDGRCHENQVGAQKAFHQGKRDGGSFINHHKFSLAQFHSICRMYILWERQFISLAWSPHVTAVITGEAS